MNSKLEAYKNFKSDKNPIQLNIEKWKGMDEIKYKNSTINFHDNIWDFSESNTLIRAKAYVEYDFSEFHEGYKDYLKEKILEDLLLQEYAFSTVYYNFTNFSKFLEYLTYNNILKVEFLTMDIFTKYIDKILKSKNEITTKKLKLRYLKKILTFINRVENNINLTQYIEYIDNLELAEIDRWLKELGKTENIFDSFFDQIISLAINDITNNNGDENLQMGAASLLLLSQIGLRIGELRLLKAGKLKDEFIEDVKIQYLEFITFKTTRSNGSKKTKTYMTEIALLAYKKLENLLNNRAGDESDYIYFNSTFKKPYNRRAIAEKVALFVAFHSDKLKCVNTTHEKFSGFSTYEIYCSTHKKKTGYQGLYVSKKYLGNLNYGDLIKVPKPHQYRVSVCNRLAIQNQKNILFISEHMNHINGDMTYHYYREEKKKTKRKNIANKFLENIQTNEQLIFSNDNTVKNQIKLFLENNQLNIRQNLDEILNEVRNQVAINEKNLGYCVKDSLSKNCQLNEEDALGFDLYMNYCFSFRDIQLTINRFKSKIKVINYNKSKGHKVQAQLEEKKLKKIINERLIEEIKELEDVISKKGKSEFINEFPDLLNVVLNIESIKKEVNEWI